ncbi:uncharacterized protein LOC111632231 [Centruroides sculpturatus]|uniref:uncharacterized protein LOC111632231 n=1 Tax=Centruroides sculpturatus TaxID=218467 RepID=UPI000C6D25B1|nr:uncharacterized protein LOC111632231 [Centruroides sculpturatus]
MYITRVGKPSVRKLQSGNTECMLCMSSYENDLQYGEMKTLNDVTVHYYCLKCVYCELMGATIYCIIKKCQNVFHLICGLQQGTLHQYFGQFNCFILQKCVYCELMGATIYCIIKKCQNVFHLICGLQQGTLHQYFGQFKSYCHVHRPKQKVPPEYITEDVKCLICLNNVHGFVSNDSLWPPCCKNIWFHRICVQKLALSTGYFFKCPLCNNVDLFVEAMKKQGIYIPSRDASWELEENAYSDLLFSYSRCDAVTCYCPKGRTYSSNESENGSELQPGPSSAKDDTEKEKSDTSSDKELSQYTRKAKLGISEQATNKYRKQKFTKKWMKDAQFSKWLAESEDGKYKFCNVILNSKKFDLVKHCKSNKHQQNASRCWRKRWYYGTLQKLALSTGYFFKCPLCNNVDLFVEAMKKQGIYIPSRDASWELEENAYSDLLFSYSRCDAVTCYCPKGRTYSSNESENGSELQPGPSSAKDDTEKEKSDTSSDKELSQYTRKAKLGISEQATNKYRKQKFTKKWMKDAQFSKWLAESEDGKYKFCNVILNSKKFDLVKHCKSNKHQQNASRLWKLLLCETCGSQGCHRKCSNLELINHWECPNCREITQNMLPEVKKKKKKQFHKKCKNIQVSGNSNECLASSVISSFSTVSLSSSSSSSSSSTHNNNHSENSSTDDNLLKTDIVEDCIKVKEKTKNNNLSLPKITLFLKDFLLSHLISHSLISVECSDDDNFDFLKIFESEIKQLQINVDDFEKQSTCCEKQNGFENTVSRHQILHSLLTESNNVQNKSNTTFNTYTCHPQNILQEMCASIITNRDDSSSSDNQVNSGCTDTNKISKEENSKGYEKIPGCNSYNPISLKREYSDLDNVSSDCLEDIEIIEEIKKPKLIEVIDMLDDDSDTNRNKFDGNEIIEIIDNNIYDRKEVFNIDENVIEIIDLND